jgi:hypothetical protein
MLAHPLPRAAQSSAMGTGALELARCEREFWEEVGGGRRVGDGGGGG